ncbi:MAG: carboxypeptidase-like regulatory domain-containing protein, partial [Planctomycetes bacterium]|nr:carboxypeptidase-like regulatory domain-containing protein [Planctomycetota bacterium]
MLLRTEEGQLIELKRSTLSRAGGEYSFTGLEAGEYVLRSDSAGFSPYQSERLQLPGNGHVRHDIFFAGEKVISGRVTDTGGNPLRASISATDLRDPALLRSRRLTFSDQQGNFRLGNLEPGPYRISARTSGHQGATENSIAPPGNLDFSLVKNGWVEGEVLDEVTGKPVEEFTAQLIPAGETDEPTSRPREVSFNKPSGRFVLEELGGGNYELSITANGYLPLSRAVTVKPAESADAGTLELSRGHSAEVSVTDPQGKPVADCRIDVSRKAASEERVQGSFLT